MLGKRLCTSDPRSVAHLQHALHDATRRGLRRLVALGQGDDRQLAALVPVETGVAALLLGRTRVCEDLSLQCFARTHELTAAETRVLAALGRGATPADIAREQGVKISTVRTQITAIRQKTGTSTIGALVRLVAGLPPMVSALRDLKTRCDRRTVGVPAARRTASGSRTPPGTRGLTMVHAWLRPAP